MSAELNPCNWPALAADRWPRAPAWVLGGRILSFCGLDRELRRLSAALTVLDPGPVLGIALECRQRTALLCMAAPRAGLIPYPLNPRMPCVERRRLLRQAGARSLLAPPDLAPGPGLRHLEPAQLEAEGRAPGNGAAAGSVQLILATSGSGGRPRGVMLSGANLAAAVGAFRQRWPLGPGDRWLACLPLFHIGGLAIVYRCLAAGAEVEFHQSFDPARVWAALRRGRISHISLVPAMLAALLDQAGAARAPTRLRMALLGGAALAPPLAERARRAGWPLCVCYGMTETAALCAADCGPSAGAEAGLAGRLLPGFEAETSAAGRLRLRGPALMAGYANPGLSPGSGLEGGWLTSGDLAHVDRGGRLWVSGRADEVLVSGGELVHPAHVEALLAACPGVHTVAVGAVADPRWGDLLVAWYRGDSMPEEVDAWCRENLPSYLRPRRFRRVSDLPLTGSGKIDRARLRELMAAEGLGDA